MIRRALRILLALVVVGLFLLAGLGLALHLGGARWAVNRLLQKVNPYAGTTLVVGSVHGDLLRGAELRDVEFRDASGEVAARASRIGARYALSRLLGDEIVIDQVTLSGGALRLKRRPDGTWDLPRKPRPNPGARQSQPPRIRILRLEAESFDVGVADVQVSKLRLRARDLLIWRGLEVEVDTLAFHAEPPLPYPALTIAGSGSLRDRRLTVRSLGVSSDSSSVALNGSALLLGGGMQGVQDVDLTALVPKLSLRDLRGIEDLFDRPGELALELRARGSAEHLSYQLRSRLDSDGGSIEMSGALPLPGAGPGGYSTEARVRGLDLRRLTGQSKLGEPFDADIRAELSGGSLAHLDGTLRLSVRGPAAGTLEARFVDGQAQGDLSAALKGIRIELSGTVRPFDSLPGYRVRGVLRPPSRFLAGRLARVRVRAEGRGGAANWSSAAELAGGTISAEGSLILGSPIRYTVTRGSVAGVAIPAGSSINGRFSLQGAGVSPSSIDARVRADLLGSTVAGRRIDSLRADLTLNTGRLGVRGLGTVEGTAVAVEADARPFDVAPSIHLRRAELRAVELQRLLPDLGMTTSATVVATGSLADGVASIHADVLDSSGRATLSAVARPLDTVPSLELRELTLEDVNLARLLDDPKLDSRIQGNITGRARGTDERDLTATVALDLGGSTVGDRLLRTGRADAELNRGRLQLTGSVASGVDSLAIAAVMDTSRAVVHARGVIHDARVDSATAVLSLTKGRRHIDTLWVQSNLGTVSGSGAFPSSLRVVGELNDIGPLAPLLGLDSLATDSLSFTAGLGTPADSLAASLTGRAHGLAINESRFGEVEVNLTGRLDPARRSLDSGNGRVTLQRFARGDATVESAAVNAVYAKGEVGISADAAVDRDRNGRIVARWFRGDSARVHLDTVQLRVVSGDWGLVHPVEIGYGRRLSFGDLVLAAGKQRIAVDGAIDRDGDQSLHVSLDSVRFGPLAELFGIRRIDGVAAGTFDLRGPAASPQAEGDVAVTFVSNAKRLGSVRGSVSWDTLGLGLHLGLIPKKGDSLTIKGVVPVQLSLAETDPGAGAVRPLRSGHFELDARTRAFQLESLEPMLASDDIGEVRGLLSLELALRGTAEEPLTSGSIRLADLKVDAPKLGATYRADIAGSLSGRELRLTSAKVRAGGGEAEITGTLRIADSTGIEGDLDATLREFQVAAGKDFGSKLSGRLHLGGTIAAPELSGKITTQNAYFYLTSGNSQGAVKDVELTKEELALVEQRFGSLATRPQRPGLTQAAALDLDVTLGPNNWIRRRSDPVVSVELGGELGIKKESAGRLEVRGDVNALSGRSFVELVGRRFELMRGGAQLKGPLESAELGLEAEYRVASQGRSTGESDVVITAEVTADTGSIAVTLGSRPNMEQRDIMSYLLTGGPATTDPTMQTASSQSYISTGASLAVGAALGSLAGSAGQQLGFDVVQILQDLQGAQTLVAGKYVSPDLYIGFRQPLTEATTDNDDPENVENVMEFEVEYAAFRKALLNFQGAGSEFRVFLRLRGGN